MSETTELYAAEQLPGCVVHSQIPNELYREYGVYKGLRDLAGNGVLTGMTRISKIIASEEKSTVTDGVESRVRVPCDGRLLYRGYDIRELIPENIHRDGTDGLLFEEAAYLLLFGELPDGAGLQRFRSILADCRTLPTHFTRDVIMKAPSEDIMNTMTRSVLTLASYDPKASDLSPENVLRQCLELISIFPMLATYGYHAYNHYTRGASMYIHRPSPELSVAENILSMLRPDSSFTTLEALVLDVLLMLHMEHGGGNNSTFTIRVITSAGSDTYSAVAAALSSLKGKKHGGANLMVCNMMDDIRANVRDCSDCGEVEAYVAKILHKEAFDRKGLVYGMGHAVYSISDPREVILKEFVGRLAKQKHREVELELYKNVETSAIKLITGERRIYKGVCPNVDFYSGFVYDMLGIPRELFTPLFAIARVVGWSAHRLEELIGAEKIMRPSYQSLVDPREYIPRGKR